MHPSLTHPVVRDAQGDAPHDISSITAACSAGSHGREACFRVAAPTSGTIVQRGRDASGTRSRCEADLAGTQDAPQSAMNAEALYDPIPIRE